MDGQFGYDVYFYFTWRDDRKSALANDTNVYDKEVNFFPSPEVMNSAEDYTPSIDCDLKRDGAPSYVGGLTVAEKAGTWIGCISRLRVTLDAELILKAYPWDTQRAYLSIESSKSTVEDVVWISASTSGLLPHQGAEALSGWKIINTGATAAVHEYPSLGESYSSLTFWIIIERVPDYFIVRFPVRGSVPQKTSPPPRPPRSLPSPSPQKTESLCMGCGISCGYGAASAVRTR